MQYRIINGRKRLATRLVDTALGFLFLPRRLRRYAAIDPESVREILIVRVAYVGDVIMTLPLLKPLRDRFPSARITFLTSSSAACVFENNPYVDRVLTLDPFWFYPTGFGDYFSVIRELRRERFDLAIDARADIRNILFVLLPSRAKRRISYAAGGGGAALTDVVPYAGSTHRVDFHLTIARHLGCTVGSLDWGFNLTDEERSTVDRLLAGNGVGAGFVAIHPGSRVLLKRWDEQRWAALCRELTARGGLEPVVLCGPGERGAADLLAERGGGLTVLEPASIRELAGIVQRAGLLVCPDSAPMHVAACVGTGVVAIFGPSKSRETGPYGEGHEVVEKPFECRAGCDETTCSNPDHQACMKAIGVDDVLDAIAGTMRRE